MVNFKFVYSDVNPIDMMDRWFAGLPINDDELKQLEEYLRREEHTEQTWVLFQLKERNIEPYKELKVWNAGAQRWGYWEGVE